MSTSIIPLALSSLLFLPRPGAEPPDRTPPSVASADGQAWVSVHGGVWVCWSAGDPDCWQRLDLEPPPTIDTGAVFEASDVIGVPPEEDPAGTDLAIDPRFGFQGSQRLWIAIDDDIWLLERGSRQARFVASQTSPVTLERPIRPTCATSGRLPIIEGGRPSWTDARRCAATLPARGCLRPRLQLRRPTGVRLRAGLSLARVEGWSYRPTSDEHPAALQRKAGFELLARVELGFDGPALLRAAQAREQLLERERWRSLPALVEGPLAEREEQAMRAIACGEVLR